MKGEFRWRCQASGCYVDKRRARLEQLYECFEGKVTPSDIDMVVERRGHFLFVEVKPVGIEPEKGQGLMLRALSRHPKTEVWVVYLGGDGCDFRDVVAVRPIVDGLAGEAVPVSWPQLQAAVRRWDGRARGVSRDGHAGGQDGKPGT